MRKEKETFYTELTYKHKCMEDFGPEVITVKKNVWDLGSEDYMDMFHTIFIGATFSEEQWKQALINYLYGQYRIDVKEPEDKEE